MRSGLLILIDVKLCCAVFMLLLVSSCAQIVNPTGGPKDVTPAKVLAAFPPDQTTRFNEKKIILEFDEFIQLSNPAQQIVISPPLNEKPEFELKGKKLNILFREPLKSNTTYTINFGNAITDVHEGNITAGLTYAFSTGDYIDSFRISGNCRNAFNLSAEKDLLVGLYNNQRFTDSTIFTSKPDYFSVTDANGAFLLQNLPDSSYHIFVFKDENKNLKYDKSEVIGFDTLVYRVSDTSIRFIQLPYFTPDAFKHNQLVDTLTRYSGRATFVLYKPGNVKISHASAAKSYTITKTGKNNLDTIYCYTSDSALPASYKIEMPDTSFLVNLRKATGKPFYPFSADISRKIELGDTLWVNFSLPVSTTDTSLITLKEDTIPVKYKYGFSHEFNRFYIVYNWKPAVRYQVEIRDSAITDIYQRYNTKQVYTWTMKTLKDYAVLVLNIKNVPRYQQYLFQLWNETESDLFKEFIITADETLTFENLLPNKLKLKVIHDKNKNRRWDNGSLIDYKLPERVYYIKDLIVLRAYWDSEQVIDMAELLK
jgi:uncharacterized protein (DUF2141 family)